MARIRSVHPSLFTDENFMALSLAARVVLPGLWTECDDQGLFAWKPLTLKARLLPADNVDMAAILAELVEREFIQKFSHEGREFGAVRNFRRFQRPKKPTNIHFLPPELRTYVGLSDDCSPPVTHLFSTEPEKSPQMEDGGGNREEEEGKKVLPAGAGQPSKQFSYSDDFEQFWKAYPTDKNMAKKPAFKQWQRLSSEKRTAAIAAIPGFRSYCDQNKSWYRPVYAERFLSQEKFEGYAGDPSITPEIIEAARDRADKLLKRGKYAEIYQ